MTTLEKVKTVSLLLVGALALFGESSKATVIWDVSTGRTYAVNDGKPYRITVDSGKGVAAVVATEGMGYWISSQVVKEKGLKPIPWKGLFGSGGPQKEKLQASWNMDKKTYEANKRVLSGNHGFGSKMEYTA